MADLVGAPCNHVLIRLLPSLQRIEFSEATTALRYRNPVIERTAISHLSKNFRGDPQPGKVAMPPPAACQRVPVVLQGDLWQLVSDSGTGSE
jgi:hypothetical protein